MSDKISNYPGTSLSEKDIRDGKVLSLHDEMPGGFAWDTGIAIGRYLAGLKEGVILGSSCVHCRKTVVPPRTVCEWCFHPMDDFVPLQDTGTVNTYSLCYVTWDMKRIKEVIILMDTPYRLKRLLEDVVSLIGKGIPVILAYNLTMADEKYYRGNAERVLAIAKKENLKGEFVLIINNRK